MSKTDLLQSSIADAKLIREVAMRNAKSAIEESFAPHIKNMLTNKINEMEAEEIQEAEGDDLRGVLANLGTPEEVAAYIESVEKDRDQYDGWSVDDFEEDFKNYLADKTDTIDENEEDFDLDALLQEMSDEEAQDIPVNNEDPNANLVTEDEDIDIEDVDAEDDDAEDDGDTEIDLENLTEDELTSFIEDVIAEMVENGELEAGEGSEDDGEDVDLDIEGENDEEGEDESLNELKSQLNESMKVNKNLRLELKELNLLNSKLLYSNKIFKNKVLTEAKKNKILNAFDKVTTVKEAKMTYELLNESLGNISDSRKSNVVKGFASNPMVIKENKGGNTNNAILEDDALFKRFKTLAGL